jgi:hypothetical protein
MDRDRETTSVSENFPLLYKLTPYHSCFGHVVNIANVAIMSHITRIAAVENATAIWEYDPALPGNRVLGGSLDVIASIRTTAIKVSDLFFHCVNLLRDPLY